jgi:ABC-2 type transport system ATP-binding protein
MNVLLGAAVGGLLVRALGSRSPRRLSVAAAAVLVGGGALEELFWRGLVLGRLETASGVGLALAVTTAGFAATHAPAFGLRGAATHVVTGGAFGGLVAATGSLSAAVSAHATYNALFAVGGGSAAAELRGVWKRLGRVDALSGVDLEVREGEVVALLGPNGAGKTTLANVLLGLRRPDRGSVTVAGPTGATPQGMGFPPTLRVREILDFTCAHYVQPVDVDTLLDRFELAELAHRQTGGLSGGETRRLAVAVAFAGSPSLAVLDEPTTGLDVESRRAVWDEVRAFASHGGAVLLTTHSLEEARALADRVVVIAHGRIVAAGEPDALAVEETFLALTGADA